MAEINTIIQLRNDSAEKWATEAGQATPLKPGEVAVEIVDGKAKLKIGTSEDSTFGNSEYFGSDVKESQVYQSEPLSSTDEPDDIAVIEGLIPEGIEVQNGDIAIVKRYITGNSGAISYTSYVYDSSYADETSGNPGWAATDGNYSASNVFLNNKITLAGDYGKDSSNHTISSIGNKRIGDSFEAGTSLQAMLMDILSQRLQPSKTDPSATIIFTNKNNNGQNDEVEIGTTYTPKYRTTFSDGKFTYDEVTGCESTEATITFDGKTKTIAANSLNGASGSMDSVVINNTTQKKFSLSYGWTASTITPKDNLGDAATNGVKIDAATGKSTTSSHGVTGFRYAFGGSNAAVIDVNSANIRALGSKTKSSNSTFEVAIDQDANFVMIAVPDGRKITKVEDGNAFGTDIFSEFTQVSGTVDVGGADATADNIGNYKTAYNVWTYAPKASLSANTYTVYIANE